MSGARLRVNRGVVSALSRLADWLEAQPRAVAGLVLLGMLLTSPSLGTGLVADDLLHQLLLREQPGIPGLAPKHVDLFHFASGDPENARLLMNHGVFAWWTDCHLRLAFMRPLSGLTHLVDHELWPQIPALMHVQSLLWFALLVWIVSRVYARLLPGRGAALLALLLFVVDDVHAPTVGWIANRSSTIALVFSLLAVLAHDRARRTQKVVAACLGPALLAVGLLAGEAALSGGAYLLAYALFLDQSSRRSRLLSLLGYAGVIVAWHIVYRHLGYGASGSGVYIDPASQPLVFLRASLTRLPILLLGTFGLPWSDGWEMYPLVLPVLRPIVLGLALATLGALSWLSWPLLRRSPSARFWAGGSALSLVPNAATFPHDRLLLATAVGAMALLATLFLQPDRAGSRLRPALLSALALVHVVLAPVLLLYRSASVANLSGLLWKADASIPKLPDLSESTLVIVNPPLVPFGAYLPIYREAAHEPRPQRLFWLATGVSDLRIARLDERTLSVRPLLGYLSDPTQLMLRSLERPLRLGEKVVLDEATFEVVDLTADGRPAEVRVRFRRALGDRRLVFLSWQGHGYVPFEPPAAGRPVVLPRVDLLTALSG